MYKTVCVVIGLLALAGCSNKTLYGMGQDYQKSQCINDAQNAEEHAKCVNASQKSYEDYEKERKALKDK